MRGLKQAGDWRWLAAAGVAGAGALLAKRTAVGLVPLLGLVVVAYGWLWLVAGKRRLQRLAGGTIVFGAVAGVLAAGLLLGSAGSTLLPAWAGRLRLNPNTLMVLLGFWRQPAGLTQFDWPALAAFGLESFWGQFSWLTIRLAPSLVKGLQWVTVLLVCGVGLGAVRWLGRRRAQRRTLELAAVVFLVAGLVFTVAAMVMQYLLVPAVYLPQGRYVFPFISAFGLLAAWGWQAYWPRRWQGLGLGLGIALLAAFDAFCLWGVIVPYFYS